MVDPPVHIPKEPDPGKHLRWGLGILALLGTFQLFAVVPTLFRSGLYTPPRFVSPLTLAGLLGALWVALALLGWAGIARRFVVIAAEVSVVTVLVVLPAIPMLALADNPTDPLIALNGMWFVAVYLVACALVASGVGKLLDVSYDHPAERTLLNALFAALALGFVVATALGLWPLTAALWALPAAFVGFVCLHLGWVASHVLLWWAAFPAWFVFLASGPQTSDALPRQPDYDPPLVLAVFLAFLTVVVTLAALVDLYCLLSPEGTERLTRSDG